MQRIFVYTILSLLIIIPGFSQDWYEKMSQGENYYEIRKSFDDYKSNVNLSRQGPIKPFERWAHRMNERTYPSGVLNNVPNYYLLHKNINMKSKSLKSNSYPSWSTLGPQLSVESFGNGRLNFVRFHPDSSDVIYVGAPAGGLWKSTNDGQTFKLMNDTLAVIGCSDVAIDYSNPNIMYLATGDRDGSDTYSIGVLKSLDGGYTWDTTGLNWEVSATRTIARLAIHPTIPNMIFAATSVGIYKSVDGGDTWERKRSDNYKDIEFKPGDPARIYLGSQSVWLSTDTGETFTNTNVSGFINRVEIAVTEDDPNIVYAVSSYGGNNGLDAVWKSTNSGQSFTKVLNNAGAGNGNNLLGWNSDGTGTGGQGFYDLAIAASPFDKDEVVIGGINVWGSTDGGSTWNIIAHWTGQGAPTIHADQHDLAYKPGTDELYAANDGGFYRTTDFASNPWENLTSNLQITQSYRLGISQNTYGYLLAGNQDNGTFRRLGDGSYFRPGGGDGFECIVDHTDDNIIYSSLYFGTISKATNGTSLSTIAGNGVNGITESGAWETPYVMDPIQNQVLYIGYNNVWRTDNGGQSWSKRNNSSLPSSGKINQLVIAPWNLDMLIVTKSSDAYLSTDAGATFSNISFGIPNLFITNVHFSPFYDPNTFTAYLTVSGYNANQKLYRTVDGGQTWQNISDGLPNVPANCVVVDPLASDESIYVGTDIGVFYKNSSMSAFEPFSNGLPNTVIEEMEVQQNEGKIIACTYGRGLWEVPLMSVVGVEDEINEEIGNAEILAFPNPFKDVLEVDFALKEQSDVTIEILDLQGKSIYKYTNSNMIIGDHSLIIDYELNDIKEGLYIMKFRANDKESTSKILKQ